MAHYRCYRTPRWSASPRTTQEAVRLVGRFDPHNLWLDLQGELPGDEENLRRQLACNPTYFHELVHCWQTFGTTSGFLMAALGPIEAVMVPEFLRGRRVLSKPLQPDRRSFDRRAGPDDPQMIFETLQPSRLDSDNFTNWLLRQFFFAYEQFNAMIDDPKGYSARERSVLLDMGGVPHGHRVQRWAEESLLRLVQMLKMEFESQVDGETWPSSGDILAAAYEEVHSKMFYPDDTWLQSKVGLLHLHEGHARFLELQLVAADDRRKASMADIQSSGLLSGVYRRAYDRFLELTALGSPEGVLDWRVHLFLVTCDYAMNPTLAYHDDVDWASNLMNEFHPGNRFERACRHIATSKFHKSLVAKTNVEFAFNHDFMLQAYSELELSAPGQNITSFSEVAAQIADLSRAVFRDKPDLASPLNALLRQHFLCMLMRSEGQGSYASPLAYFLDGRPLEILLPPIVSANGAFELVRSHHDSWAAPSATSNLVFLAEQLYSDMVRQLISDHGEFYYDLPWIPPDLAEVVKPAAQAMFRSLFGVDVDEVKLQ